MRILVAHPQGSGVENYRALIPAAELKRQGVDITCKQGLFENAEKVAAWLYDNAKDYDLLHTGYVTNQDVLKYLIAAREYAGIPIITDIDDDVFNVPEYNLAFNAYHGSAHGRKVARMHLRMSDMVTVSTFPLCKVLESNSPYIKVLPNCIDLAQWKNLPANKRHGDTNIRLFFAGNLGRYGDLTDIQSAIEHVLTKHDNIRMFFMACFPDWVLPWAKDLKDATKNKVFFIQPCSVTIYNEILTHISPDIIFAPVQQNIFNKSKSHIKAYDAAMTGAAFICSDWDTYEDVPTTAAVKVNGDYEWREGLDALIEDAELRTRLAARLKTWALDTWTIDKHINKWVDLYEETIARGPITSLDQIVRPAIGR